MTDPAETEAPSAPAIQPPTAEVTAAATSAPLPPLPMSQVKWPVTTIKLTRPLPLPGGCELSEVVLDEPDLETMEAISDVLESLGLMDESKDVKLGIRQLRPILAAFTGIDGEVLKKLHYKDVAPISEAMAPLLEGLVT